MTDLREKLADICDAEIQSDSPSCYTLADTIIAALPDMVKPLVWMQSGHHYAGGYGYVIRQMGRRSVLTMRNKNPQEFDTLEDAKAAANAHHVAQVMAALGVEMKGERND